MRRAKSVNKSASLALRDERLQGLSCANNVLQSHPVLRAELFKLSHDAVGDSGNACERVNKSSKVSARPDHRERASLVKPQGNLA